jgi:hypothetical protein
MGDERAIEITPEMVDAGLDVLCHFNAETDDASRIVREIIFASLEVHLRQKRTTAARPSDQVLDDPNCTRASES